VKADARKTRLEKEEMVILGIILLVLGIVLSIPILETIGIILLVIGAVLWLLGAVGRPVGGRRYWY
jgi:uncharacterized membrane protein HdeD (DUF308 family)